MKAAKLRSIRPRCDAINTSDSKNIHVELLDDYTLIINPKAEKPEDRRIYTPSPTFKKFHADRTFVRAVMGAYGSGKTSGCMIDAVINAILMPKCIDGVRRSKLFIVRNTFPELETTTIPTWDNWFGNMGIVKRRLKSPMIYSHKFNDKDGKIMLSVLFLALDNPKDIRKLKSSESTFIILEEASELDVQTLVHSKARVGRYPPEQICKEPFHKRIIMPTNPPDESHWFYDLFEVSMPEKHVLYKQPPALLWSGKELVINPDAENIEHLNGGYDYYFDYASGQTNEFIKVFVQGKYGILKYGHVVYNEYNDDMHSVDDIALDEKEHITITVDYGTFAPAMLICQYVAGQLRAIKEFCATFMTVKELWLHFVLPWIKQKANNFAIEIYGDPANTYDGRTQLEECGLIVNPAPSNKIDLRISSIVDLLTTLVQGNPRFILSKKGCPKLREGFLKNYHYRELQTISGRAYKDVPDKNHPYSDIHDCLQYQGLLVSGGFQDVDDSDKYDDIRKYNINEKKNRVTGY